MMPRYQDTRIPPPSDRPAAGRRAELSLFGGHHHLHHTTHTAAAVKMVIALIRDGRSQGGRGNMKSQLK